MIARRCADDGRPEARTQRALEYCAGVRLKSDPSSFSLWARARTQHQGVQRRTATWPFVALGALGAVAAALVLAASASAHVVAQPSYIATGESSTLELRGPNERDAPMTGFSVSVPNGLEILHAHPVDGWEEAIEGQTATWNGGSLAANSEETFGIQLEASVEPGIVALDVEQLYEGGEVVRWPVSLTVVPSSESPSQNLGLAAVVGLIGLLAVAAVAVLAWRRRAQAT